MEACQAERCRNNKWKEINKNVRMKKCTLSVAICQNREMCSNMEWNEVSTETCRKGKK